MAGDDDDNDAVMHGESFQSGGVDGGGGGGRNKRRRSSRTSTAIAAAAAAAAATDEQEELEQNKDEEEVTPEPAKKKARRNNGSSLKETNEEPIIPPEESSVAVASVAAAAATTTTTLDGSSEGVLTEEEKARIRANSPRKIRIRDPQELQAFPQKPTPGGLVDLFGDDFMRGIPEQEDSANVDPLRLQILENERQACKESLEQERLEVMEKLPEHFIKQFGQIGFAKYYRMLMPILLLDPYKVPPNPIRFDWLVQLEEDLAKNKPVSYVAYWYGFAETEPKSCYAYLKPNDVTMYSAAEKKNMHKLPKKIQEKIDKGKKLTVKDQNIVRAFQEMEEDLDKDPSERKRGVEFQEAWESISLDDIPIVTAKEETDEMSEELMEEEDTKPPAKRKTEKKKSAAKKKKTKRVSMKKQKEKRDAEELEEETGIEEQLVDQLKTQPSGAVEQPRKPDAFEEVTMDQIGEKDESSDDEKDGDYKEGGVAEVDDDLVQDNDDSAPKKSRARQHKSPQKLKRRQSGENKTTKPKKEVSEKTKKDKERKAFRKCEQEYSSLLVQWNDTLKKGDPAELNDVLTTVLGKVKHFSATFIETYDVAGTLKNSKNLLKAESADLTIQKEVWDACKVTYTEKKKAIPEGFKMKKTEERKGASSLVKALQKETVALSKPVAQASNIAKEAIASSSVAVADITIPKKGVGKSFAASPPKKKLAPSVQPGGERKQFSLMGLMSHGQKDGSQSKEESKQVTTAAPKPREPVGPKSIGWMTEPYTTSEPLSDSERMMALEFLRGMASQFPDDKMNRESITRSVEAAIYKEAKEKYGDAWSNPYCLKVHMVVSCVMGKSKLGSKPGTLIQMLMSGQFNSAESLVALSDDQFAASYEGLPVTLTK